MPGAPNAMTCLIVHDALPTMWRHINRKRTTKIGRFNGYPHIFNNSFATLSSVNITISKRKQDPSLSRKYSVSPDWNEITKKLKRLPRHIRMPDFDVVLPTYRPTLFDYCLTILVQHGLPPQEIKVKRYSASVSCHLDQLASHEMSHRPLPPYPSPDHGTTLASSHQNFKPENHTG